MTVESFLSKHAKKLSKNNGGWICCCLYPSHKDSTPSFHVSWEGLYMCWGCEQKGNFARLLHDIEGYSWKKAIDTAATVSKHVSLDDIQRRSEESKDPQTLSKGLLGLFAVDWSDGYQQYLFKKQSRLPPWTFPFEKGFMPRTLEYFHAGYDEDKQRVMIPVFDDDEDLRGFIGRACHPDTFPKYLIYPPLRTALHLYNETSITDDADHVILTEGPWDVWALWQKGIKIPSLSLFTSDISDVQARRLKAYGKTYVLMFDMDKAGKSGAIKVAQKLLAYGLKIDLGMQFPYDVQDVKILNKSQIMHAFETRIPFPSVRAYDMLRSEPRKL